RYLLALIALCAMLVVPTMTVIAGRTAAGDAVARGARLGRSFLPAHKREAAPIRVALPPAGAPFVVTHSVTLSEMIARGLPWIVDAWLAGLFMLVARLIVGIVGVRRVANRGVSGVPPGVRTVAEEIAAHLGLRRAIRVLESTRVDVPMVVGWVAPAVLLPASLLTGLTPAQIEMLLAHELAHIRRYDTIANFAATIVESLLFYHPAARWISRRVREEREDCCDDLAIAATRCDRVAYGRALLAVEEFRGMSLPLATAATDGSLLRRIRRLLDGERKNNQAASAWSATIVIVSMLVIVAVGRIAGATVHPRAGRMPLHAASALASALGRDSFPARQTKAPGTASKTVTRVVSPERTPMPNHKILIGAAVVAVAAANAGAQSTPSFAGKWTIAGCDGCADSSNVAALRTRNALAPGWGADVTVRQDRNTLSVIDSTPRTDAKTVYSLSEPAAAQASRDSNGYTHVVIRTSELAFVQSTPAWKGNSLVIPVTATRDSTSVSYTMTLSVDSSGDLLVEWALRSGRLVVGGIRMDFSSDVGPGFHGSGRDKLTLRYRRVPAQRGTASGPEDFPRNSVGVPNVISVLATGVEFPYPVYLSHAAAAIHLQARQNPPGAVEVRFVIGRDGSIGPEGIRLTKSSSAYSFDQQVIAAVADAGDSNRLGPLPAGFGGGTLPVILSVIR
ncbi:MAG TPA: M56 family metallopeptidase, partial [Gemmatimonadaceae bacterium]|nr:M56 family metallopeptidase [Gemmatimonadaceae bacterium]